MNNSIGLRIRDNYKIIPIKINQEEYNVFSYVVVETNRGEECGQIVLVPEPLFRTKRDIRIIRILRKANDEDIKKINILEEKEKEYYKIANNVLTELNYYDTKIVHCEMLFNQDKIIFYYRENDDDMKRKHKKFNVREIAEEISRKTDIAIELREVGDIGAAKIMGGLGPCGRAYCCTSWLGKTICSPTRT